VTDPFRSTNDRGSESVFAAERALIWRPAALAALGVGACSGSGRQKEGWPEVTETGARAPDPTRRTVKSGGSIGSGTCADACRFDCPTGPDGRVKAHGDNLSERASSLRRAVAPAAAARASARSLAPSSLRTPRHLSRCASSWRT
jgi:hypothetical protein